MNRKVIEENNQSEESKVYESMDDAKVDSIYYIKFKKPYNFEGETYSGIDLSDIENISTKQLLESDKLFIQMGYVSPTSEMTLAYACIVASKVSRKPLEFFNSLPGNESMKIKNAVVNFLYN